MLKKLTIIFTIFVTTLLLTGCVESTTSGGKNSLTNYNTNKTYELSSNIMSDIEMSKDKIIITELINTQFQTYGNTALKYQFEVKDVVTNKFNINLTPIDKNTYKLFMGTEEHYIVSEYKPFLSGYIKLNKRKDRLKFKIATLKPKIVTTEDIITVIKLLVGK